MYTDDELHRLVEDAMKRGDDIFAAAVVAVAIAHGMGKDRELLQHLMMWNNFQTRNEQSEKGGSHGFNPDPAALDPDTIVSL